METETLIPIVLILGGAYLAGGTIALGISIVIVGLAIAFFNYLG